MSPAEINLKFNNLVMKGYGQRDSIEKTLIQLII